MKGSNGQSKSGFFTSIVSNKCPRCRKGKLFKTDNPYQLSHILDMEKHCPVCGQKTELEVGFWYGTGYISYVLAVFFSAFNLLWYWLIFGITWKDDSIIYWLIVNGTLLILFMPILMRLSRMVYLNFYVYYDPETDKLD